MNLKTRAFLGIVAVFSLLYTIEVPAQISDEPYWFILEKGKRFYRAGEYGKALIAFEDAKRKKDDFYGRMQEDFISFLSLNEVRSLGDSLSKIERYLRDKPNQRISAIIAEIKFQFSDDTIQDSPEKILSLFDILRLFPEAEYWIGEVYQVEGEIQIALKQYERALSQQLLIEPNEFTIEIRYKIAEMQHLLGDYPNYEKTLIAILSSDRLWSNDDRSQAFIRNAMFKTLTEDGINRFLTLYRYELPRVEPAHRQLGFYYYATGRYDKAVEHLTYAFLIQNTMLLKEFQSREYGFVFSDYRKLLVGMKRYSDLEKYMQDMFYYKTDYYLAAALFAVGERQIAMSLWTVLSEISFAGEWQKRSQIQLKKPYIEPVNQRP